MKKIFPAACRTLAVVSITVACALPAAAQNTAGGDTAATTTTVPVQEEDRDYGWIGLLGLAGLLGLRRKPDDHRTTTTTHNR